MMMMTTMTMRTRGSKVCHNDTSLHKKFQSEPEPQDLDTGKLVLKKEIGTETDTVVHYGVYGGQEVAVYWCDKRCIKIEVQKPTRFPNKLLMCVVSAFQSGGTLKSYLIKNSKRKLSFKTVIKLAMELARDLSYLHSKKIVYRNIKTENILLDKGQTVKIINFGVARVESPILRKWKAVLAHLVTWLQRCLSVNHITGNATCTYYCNTPYRGFYFSQGTPPVIYKNSRLEIPKGCPNSLAEVMKKCWDLNPDKRPEMQEILSTLEDLYGTLKSKNKGCFWWRP